MFKVFCLLVIAVAMIENSSVEGKDFEMKKKITRMLAIILLSLTGIRRNRRGSGSTGTGMSLTVVEGIQEKPRGCRGKSCRPKKSSSCKCKNDDADCKCRKQKSSCNCPKPIPCVRTFLLEFKRYFFPIHQFHSFTELSQLRWYEWWYWW